MIYLGGMFQLQKLRNLEFLLVRNSLSGDKIFKVITLCMKSSWFCPANSRQLFCNCSLFVTVLVLGVLFGGKQDEMCYHSVVAEKSSQSVCSTGGNTTT